MAAPGENNLTLSQVHFPRVSVVLHTRHTAACVCIQSETKTLQLPEFQRKECDDSDQTDFKSMWGNA